MVTYYKIYSRSRDRYLLGTPSYSKWSDDGRLFGSVRQVRQFLSNTMNSKAPARNKIDTSDWEIQEFKMVLIESKNVMDVIKPEKVIQLLKGN